MQAAGRTPSCGVGSRGVEDPRREAEVQDPAQGLTDALIRGARLRGRAKEGRWLDQGVPDRTGRGQGPRVWQALPGEEGAG